MTTPNNSKPPRLFLVELTTDGVKHTRQVDAAQLEQYDEQDIAYRKVDAPLTGDAEQDNAAATPANKSATPSTK